MTTRPISAPSPHRTSTFTPAAERRGDGPAGHLLSRGVLQTERPAAAPGGDSPVTLYWITGPFGLELVTDEGECLVWSRRADPTWLAEQVDVLRSARAAGESGPPSDGSPRPLRLDAIARIGAAR